MNFCSDNVTGASPEILAALTRANAGTVPSYGEDPLTARVEAKLKEIFETDLAAFPVATGTSANALSLSVMTPALRAPSIASATPISASMNAARRSSIPAAPSW